MTYEKCETCKHIWHGLACELKVYVRNEEHQRWERVECRCPSQFSRSS